MSEWRSAELDYRVAQVAQSINTRAFTKGRLRVIVGQELQGRWHMSISHPFRLPTWDEIGEARDALLPAELHFCIPHPPREFWMNLHPFCLHMWELRDDSLIEMFEAEGRIAEDLGYGDPS